MTLPDGQAMFVIVNIFFAVINTLSTCADFLINSLYFSAQDVHHEA